MATPVPVPLLDRPRQSFFVRLRSHPPILPCPCSRPVISLSYSTVPTLPTSRRTDSVIPSKRRSASTSLAHSFPLLSDVRTCPAGGVVTRTRRNRRPNERGPALSCRDPLPPLSLIVWTHTDRLQERKKKKSFFAFFFFFAFLHHPGFHISHGTFLGCPLIIGGPGRPILARSKSSRRVIGRARVAPARSTPSDR
jgi:hypothetical protein